MKLRYSVPALLHLCFWNFLLLQFITSEPLPRCPRGQYTITRCLDSLGYTYVYETNDPNVVLKVIYLNGPNMVDMIFRNFRVFDTIDTPSLVLKALCYDFVDFRIAFALPRHVQSLGALQRGKAGNFTPDELHSYFEQIIESVRVIHSANFIHHGIEPDNFLVTVDGKILLHSFDVTVVEGEDFAGYTPRTVAPEVCLNSYIFERPACYLADWYSVGRTMYILALNTEEIVTGYEEKLRSSGIAEKYVDMIIGLTNPSVDVRLNLDKLPYSYNPMAQNFRLVDPIIEECQKQRVDIATQLLNAAIYCDIQKFDHASHNIVTFRQFASDLELNNSFIYRYPHHLAAFSNCCPILEKILEISKRTMTPMAFKTFINIKDDYEIPEGLSIERPIGATAIKIAANNCQTGTEAIDILLSYGADVNLSDDNGITPLMLLAFNNCANEIEKFLKHDPPADIFATTRGMLSLNAVNLAVENGSLNVLKEFERLLTQDNFVTLVKRNWDSYLIDVVIDDQPEILDYILSQDYLKDALIYLQSSEGYTLLHFAILHKNYALIPKLLVNGVDPTIRANSSWLPQLHAAELNAVDCLKSLFTSEKIDKLAMNNEGLNMANIAAYNGSLDVLKYLKEILTENEWKQITVEGIFTALMSAIENNQLETINWFFSDPLTKQFVNRVSYDSRYMPSLCFVVQYISDPQTQMDIGVKLLNMGAEVFNINCGKHGLLSNVPDESFQSILRANVGEITNKFLQRRRAMIESIKSCNLDDFKLCTSNVFNFYESIDAKNKTYLHFAIESRCITIVYEILSKTQKYDVKFLQELIDDRDDDGNTPLSLAKQQRNDDMDELLLFYGATPVSQL